jgi:hypothetical protein
MIMAENSLSMAEFSIEVTGKAQGAQGTRRKAQGAQGLATTRRI